MCGICGQYNFETRQAPSAATLHAMADAIAHRGPDDSGFHFDRGVALGFRRLSIIDLAGGHQPMSDAEQRVWVTFNGEIYNFPELKQELEGLGHRFRTRSDTEVIVHGYKQWGEGVFSRLNGMFGVAIWDATRERLLLARDRAGIKLVYYRIDQGTVWFGSELRAVLAAQPTLPPVDLAALNLFLRYRYTPSPFTLHAGIHKLAPGQMAVFEKGGFRVERWHVPVASRQQAQPPGPEAAEELQAIYQRAARRHLLSDVPVGLLLSGGVDSGLLLGLMNQSGSAWPTFSVGYGKALYAGDELGEAARTAAHFGARHAEVRLSVEAFERDLPRVVSLLEEPVAASSVVPMFHVCQRARQDVKVAWVGQGPDELFAGYKRHLGVHYGRWWRALPGWLRRCMAGTAARLPRNETLQRGLRSLDTEPRMARHRDVLSLMPGEVIDRLFREEFRPAAIPAEGWWDDLCQESSGMDELAAFQHLEIFSTLPDELLMYADKLSMANSLELRTPYLDNEVVDFAQRLAPSQKIRRGQQKWLHREVARRFLPAEVLERRKRGFAVDAVDSWLRNAASSELGQTLADPGSLMYRYLRPDAVQALLQQHRSGQRDNHKLLFSLVVLEQWLRGRETWQAPRSRDGTERLAA